MTSELIAEQRRIRRITSWYIPAAIVLGLLTWFTQGNVSTANSIGFFLRQFPLLWLIIVVGLAAPIIEVIGFFKQWEWFTSRLWPHILAILLYAAMLGVIAANRYNCENDVNVKARYEAFIK